MDSQLPHISLTREEVDEILHRLLQVPHDLLRASNLITQAESHLQEARRARSTLSIEPSQTGLSIEPPQNTLSIESPQNTLSIGSSQNALKGRIIVWKPEDLDKPRKLPKPELGEQARDVICSILRNRTDVIGLLERATEDIVGDPIQTHPDYPWFTDLTWLESEVSKKDKWRRWSKRVQALFGLIALLQFFSQWSQGVHIQRTVQNLRSKPSARDFADAHNFDLVHIKDHLLFARRLCRIALGVGLGVIPFLASSKWRTLNAKEVDMVVKLCVSSNAVQDLVASWTPKVEHTLQSYQVNRRAPVMPIHSVRLEVCPEEADGRHSQRSILTQKLT